LERLETGHQLAAKDGLMALLDLLYTWVLLLKFNRVSAFFPHCFYRMMMSPVAGGVFDDDDGASRRHRSSAAADEAAMQNFTLQYIPVYNFQSMLK
jgi:hypothetical protein